MPPFHDHEQTTKYNREMFELEKKEKSSNQNTEYFNLEKEKYSK